MPKTALPTLEGYTTTEIVHDGARSLVVRARRTEDGTPVVLKIPQPDAGTAGHARLRHEFAAIRQVGEGAVARAFALERAAGGLVLVLEDVPGASLDVRAPRLLAPLLQLFERIALALAQVHAQGVIHKDLHPANILATPSGDDVRLVDFASSSCLPAEEHGSRAEGAEGSLAYMAPEQTGRLNRAVDDRADLYSLGATFYALLIGAPPFAGADASELVHAHIARVPPPPHAKREDVPAVVSAIVMKLLAKSPEERYQSAAGLAHDLSRARRELESTGTATSFELGTEDVRPRFRVSDKFYGRAQELAAFESLFTRAASGRAELCFVVGSSGVGKTSLVHEARRLVAEQRGYFAVGKCDQFKRDVPYAAILLAFRDLLGQIASEPETRVASFREDLREALSPNAAVLTAVLPELEWLVGDVPPVPDLPAADAQHRFHRAVLALVRVFASPAHPLVVFLDDLQWTDSGTASLLEGFATLGQTTSLFVVGSYRKSEVDAAHPIALLRDRLAAAGAPAATIDLEPLPLAEVTHLVADTVRCSAADALPLAEIVFARTHGNPFFVVQLLSVLHREKILRWDGGARRWQWSLEDLGAIGASENVVDLLLETLRRLPGDALEVCATAACIGDVFDLGTLARVCGKSPERAAADLSPALREGLLAPLGSTYKAFHAAVGIDAGQELPDARTVRYRFVHDRIQQAAHDSLAKERRAELHAALGRLLCAELGDGDAALAFAALDHFHDAESLLVDPDERRRIAELALRTARRAKGSAAFSPAARYLRFARSLLPDDAWDSAYALALGVHHELAECEYLTGHGEAAEALYTLLAARARTSVDRANVLTTQVIQYATEDKVDLAIEAGLRGLRLLGLRIRKPGRVPDLLWALARVRAAALGTSPENLAAAPLEDEVVRAKLRLIGAIMVSAYESGDVNLYATLAIRGMDLVLRYGACADGAFPAAAYAVICVAALADYERARVYGELAKRIAARFSPGNDGPILYCLGWFVTPWHAPLHEAVELLDLAARRSRDAGDMTYTVFSVVCRNSIAFYAGLPLADVLAAGDEVRALLARHDDFTMGFASTNLLNLAAHLVGTAAGDSLDIVDPRYGTDEAVVASGNLMTSTSLYGYKTLLCIHLGDEVAALRWARRCDETRDAIAGSVVGTFHYLYFGLALTAAADRSGGLSLSDRRLLARNERKLRSFADQCASNYTHALHLLRAERLRVEGKTLDALAAYDLAIEDAKTQGIVLHEALANELAGRASLANGQRALATVYLSRAHEAYARWGARRKLAQLEARYGELVRGATPATGAASVNVDLVTVLRAAQAISTEMHLGRLLERMMKLVLENAGAERAVLLLGSEGKQQVRAVGTVEGGTVHVQVGGDTAASARSVSPGVVKLVERTRAPLVLNDARTDARFRRDPVLVRDGARSVAALPLLTQGRLIGVLHLENRLVTGAFRVGEDDVLPLLAAQLAVAIENAEIYEALEDRVRERTAALHVATENLQRVFDHMRQAIVVFDEDGCIHGEVSRQARTMFGGAPLEGAHLVDLLFPDAKNLVSERDCFDEWRSALFSVPLDALDELLALAPTEAIVPMQGGGTRVLGLEFRPIVQGDKVSGVMMLATDETEQRRLERAASEKDAAHARQLTAMRKLVAGGSQPLVTFLRTADTRIERLVTAATRLARAPSARLVDDVFQIAHTLKGEARAFELEDLERRCAELEAALGALGPRGAGTQELAATAAIPDLVGAVQRAVEEARATLVLASPIGRAVLEQVTVQRADLEALLALAPTGNDAMAVVARRLASRPFGELTVRLAAAVPAWAESLGKSAHLVVEGREALVPPALAATLPGVLTHLVRNAVAHGIEAPQARRRAKKDTLGRIRVACLEEGMSPVFVVEDDGAGLDTAALRARADALGIPYEEGQEAELAFADGLSTAPVADALAGHGVGLAAARAELRALGYELAVSSTAGAGTRFTLRRRAAKGSWRPSHPAPPS